MTRTPEDLQIGIAAEWLRSNEGQTDEKSSCIAVADWIEALRYERKLRSAARSGGVTVARLRRKLAESRANELTKGSRT